MTFILSGYVCFRNRQSCLRNYLILYILKMPFYAVAKGRSPGVYRTWEECQNQTKGFPQAKFRKFNTENEAAEFIRTITFTKSELLTNGSSIPSVSTSLENLHPPELKALGKYSSQTLLKQDKLSIIAEKLDDFIEKTNKKLNEFAERLNQLEAGCSKKSVEGKRKPDLNNEFEDCDEPKKKKALVTEIAGDTETKGSVKNKSKSASGEVEEVDYPWGSSSNSSRFSPGGFVVDPEGFVVVYTDGACTNNGKRGAKAGVGVWFNHDHPFNVAAPVEGNATNNNAEIQAATRAIDQAILAGIRKLNIHTDSQFMINCITGWIKKWKRNNWVTSAGGPVKNKEQLLLLDGAIQRMEAVKWTHVRGHMGNIGNECADALAVQGASMYKL